MTAPATTGPASGAMPASSHARHHSIALRPELNLESQQEVQSLTFRTILAIAFANAFGELMCALSPVDFQSFK